MSGECERWHEVEAADDGRFGPRDVERVERHVTGCAWCRARRERLRALREEARTHAAAPLTELERHRARAALLRAAARGRDDARPASPRVAAVVTLAVAAGAALWVAARRDEAIPRSAPVAHAEAMVSPVGGARWSRRVERARETIVLEEGVLRVTVPHQHPAHRFVVALPDGELEVRGTRFIVDVHDGRTRGVTVFEGLVALRVARDGEQLIAAGGRWQRALPDASVPSVAAAAHTPVAAPPPSPAVPTPHAPHAGTSARPAASRDAGAPAEAQGPTRDGAFGRFADGVSALGRGDFRRAADDLEAFERLRPDDERADDAGWLRAVALRRAGDESAAEEAAQRYLTRYAAGAHRGEAATMVARAAWRRGDCARVTSLAAAEGARSGAAELARYRELCARDAGR